jgi:transposase InsO family protein
VRRQCTSHVLSTRIHHHAAITAEAVTTTHDIEAARLQRILHSDSGVQHRRW